MLPFHIYYLNVVQITIMVTFVYDIAIEWNGKIKTILFLFHLILNAFYCH